MCYCALVKLIGGIIGAGETWLYLWEKGFPHTKIQSRLTYVLYTTDENPRIETSCSTECITAVICSNKSYQRYHAAMNLYFISEVVSRGWPHETGAICSCNYNPPYSHAVYIFWRRGSLPIPRCINNYVFIANLYTAQIYMYVYNLQLCMLVYWSCLFVRNSPSQLLFL